MSTLAEDLWAAERAASLAEDKIGDLLDALLGADGWSDFHTDSYDLSIEIFGVSPDLVLNGEQTAALQAAGFLRCWTHTHASKSREPGERSYGLSPKETP